MHPQSAFQKVKKAENTEENENLPNETLML